MSLASESIDPIFPPSARARLSPSSPAAERPVTPPPSRAPMGETPREPGARAQVAGLFRALVGLGLLGAAAGLGALGDTPDHFSHTSRWGITLRMIPATVLNIGGAVLLSSPALVAIHQYLDLRARPEALAAALTRGVILVGQLAAGLAPVVLFFSATTNLWLPAFLASMLGLGAVGYIVCARELTKAERAGAESGDDAETSASVEPAPRFHALVHGWLLLTLLIALRLGVDLADFVLNTRQF